MTSGTEPCVFIYGPEATVVGTIIQSLTGPGAERSTASDMVVSFPWRIDNKYYTADISLCYLQRKGLPDKPLADRCEAVIICFDSDEANGLDEVDCILSFTKEFEPDVCLLVCETCDDNTPISRLRAQEWCVGHGFELVELTPAYETDPDDDFPETTGVQRIAQALHAHPWSNLEMKDHQPTMSNKLVNEITAERAPNSGGGSRGCGGGPGETLAASQVSADDAQTAATVDTLVSELAGLMGSAGGGGGGGGGGGEPSDPAGNGDDFELLFSRLAELRAAAARAPPDQRHDMAERVAMAFLRSMGGDEDDAGEDSD